MELRICPIYLQFLESNVALSFNETYLQRKEEIQIRKNVSRDELFIQCFL